MTKFLLSVHVLAAIIAIGPVTVAASMFPAATRRALAQGEGEPAVLGNLHRICQVYAAVGVAVPIFGVATASGLGVLGEAWLIVSMVLTAAAAAVLALLILPRQADIITAVTAAARPGQQRPTQTWRTPARLAMYTGTFNILWATVTVLMIVRPGSTTGA